MLKKVCMHCRSKYENNALPDVSRCKLMLLLLHACSVMLMLMTEHMQMS